MNPESYTERARAVIQAAQSSALAARHQQFTPEHLLKAMLEDKDQLAANLITASGGRADLVRSGVDEALTKLPAVSGGNGQLYMAQETAQVFQEAEKTAKAAGDSFVTVERLLLAITTTASTKAADVLKAAGVTPQALTSAIEKLRQGRTADSETAEEGYEALKKYARDLTEDARSGKLDPVIGRDEEIRRTVQVLSRRTKTIRF